MAFACAPATPPGREYHTGNPFALHHEGRRHRAQLQSSLSRILDPKIACSKIAQPAAVSASLAYNMAPASGTQWFYPARLRSYIFRLPLLTRIIVLAIVAFWISELQSFWNVVQWGALIPSQIGFGTSESSADCGNTISVWGACAWVVGGVCSCRRLI